MMFEHRYAILEAVVEMLLKWPTSRLASSHFC